MYNKGRLQQSEKTEKQRYKDALDSLLATQHVIQEKVDKLVRDNFVKAREGRASLPQFNPDFMPGFPVVYSRVKDRDSCLARIAERHAGLEELPDLIGCRVVVIHSEEIRLVKAALGSLLRKRVPTRIEYDAGVGRGRGYSGIYYTIPLKDADAQKFCKDLSDEHKKVVASFQLELQIHTVMEEAWSRVSHAGFYKAKEGIPKDVYRKLQRLASASRLLDEHLMDLSMSIKDARDILKEKFEKSHADAEVDEFLLWYCTGDDSYIEILTEFADLGESAGLQKSDWQDLVVVGDETDICLEVCQRTELKTWGALDDALWAIEDRRESWKKWLELVVKASNRPGGYTPYNRPLLVFSIVRLLEYPSLPSIDSMYGPLWQEIDTVHRMLGRTAQFGPQSAGQAD